MEASMHGFAAESRARKRVVGARPDSTINEAASVRRARASRGPARVEHTLTRVEPALFAIVLGCVGYVWLGALLAEAAQAL